MPGTKQGGLNAKNTNIDKYGENFYKLIGHMGGIAHHKTPRGFAADRERASWAGKKGGSVSKRGIQKYCRRGHEFTEENIYYKPYGRVCRECASVRAKRDYLKAKAKLSSTT